MDIPKKKRRTEEKVDFKKCIICETDKTEPLVKNVSNDAYKTFCFTYCLVESMVKVSFWKQVNV